MESVGQYTGLKDCNNVKIFEGDIIKCEKENPEEIGHVVYHDDGFRICLRGYPDCGQFSLLWWMQNTRYKYVPGKVTEERVLEGYVLGNIHENPELLKGVTNGTE